MYRFKYQNPSDVYYMVIDIYSTVKEIDNRNTCSLAQIKVQIE
jgi:hypothetical protein